MLTATKSVISKLAFLNGVIICSSLIAILASYELMKSSKLHELNYYHANDTHSFFKHSLEFEKGYYSNLGILRRDIAKIRQSSSACINTFVLFQAGSFSTSELIKLRSLCQEDLDESQRLLESMEQYESGLIAKETFGAILLASVDLFIYNSQAADPLINNLVDQIFQFFLIGAVFISILVIGFVIFLTRLIRRDYLEAHRTKAQILSNQVALKESKERYALSVRGSSVGLWDWNIREETLYWSPKFREIVKMDNEHNFRDMEEFAQRLHSDHRDPVLNAIRDHLSKRTPFDTECQLQSDDGGYIWVHVRGQAIWNDEGRAIRMAGSIDNIDARKQAEAEIAQHQRELEEAKEIAEKLAYFDDLTSLPNRTACKRDLKAKFSDADEQDEFAIIHLDLDNFKRVNDTLGHGAGDLLLQVVGERLKLCTEGVAQAYRWNGDEFIISIENHSQEEITAFCQELTDLLSISLYYEGTAIWPSASLGVARFPEDGSDFDSLMIYADLALYKSKQEGRDNFHFFTKDMKAKIDDEARIEAELRLAIEREELFLAYQPQVDVATQEITGLEALIRWQHPERGVLSPGAFLDVVEASKMAPIVGRYVIDHALKAARSWIDKDIDFGRIAINLSPQHLKTGTLVSDFRHYMEMYEIPAHNITAEVVESVFLNDSKMSGLEIIEQLHNMGLHIELDDFGTGYASLSHLSSLPIDGLKIDKSFTDKMLVDNKKAVVIQSLTSLAKLLGMNLICEGVETGDQLAKLQQLGDCSIQGYLISKPIAFDDITNWMMTRPDLKQLEALYPEKKVAQL